MLTNSRTGEREGPTDMHRSTVWRVGVAALTTLGLAVPAGVAHAAAATQVRQQAKHGVTGDFDGDGRRDLAIGAPQIDRVQIRYTRARPEGSRVEWVGPHAHSVSTMHFGGALAVADFDGDGYSDLAIGAADYQPTPQNDDEAPMGAAFVLYGSRSGLRHSPQFIPGPGEGAQLGAFVAAADIDADGYADLAVSQERTAGGVHVYYGSSAGLRANRGKDVGPGFHGRMAFGDVNGDGYADLVGADLTTAEEDGESGTVRVWNGRETGIATKAYAISGNRIGVIAELGSSIASGDIDADGYADVAIGNSLDGHGRLNDNRGSIVVLLGGRHGLAASRSARLSAGSVDDHAQNADLFGDSVDIAKVTGDRYADVVVGAPGARVTGHPDAGAVYLLRGSAHGLTRQHVQRLTLNSAHVPGAAHTSAGFGSTVHVAQHVGSHNADLLAWVAGNGSGYVLRFTGTDAGLSTRSATQVDSPTTNDQFGYAIA